MGLPSLPYLHSLTYPQTKGKGHGWRRWGWGGKTVGCGALKPEASATETSHTALLSLFTTLTLSVFFCRMANIHPQHCCLEYTRSHIGR